MNEWAVGDHLHARLAEPHGYELIDEDISDFRKIVDTQHAVTVNAAPTGGRETRRTWRPRIERT